LEKDGIRVAIIAVCENEFGVATSKTSGTAGYSLGRVAKAIWQAREDGYKPVIYFHGGNEKNPFPSPGKVELYRHFVDLGAQAVVAMHTHCPQGYEIYEGKPIIYSMGNFFFPANVKEQSWYYGYMTQLEFTEETVNLAIHPYRFDYEGVKMLSGEDIAYFTRYMQVLCEPIGNEDALQELFDSWHYIGGYIHGFDWFEPHYIADGWSRQVKDMKNIFNCEAHNELVRNTFNMVFEGRMEKAKGLVEFIQKLQNMQID
jgi:poly-gamma-glutamate synthesis protein (capsule biosynthesis protein)